ncbi:hypothetical protein D3C86_1241210 [compost metagenome]
MVNVGGSIEPLFTASNPPIFKDSIFDFSKMLTENAASFPFASIASASCVAFSPETGSFTRSRAQKTAFRVADNSSITDSEIFAEKSMFSIANFSFSASLRYFKYW